MTHSQFMNAGFIAIGVILIVGGVTILYLSWKYPL